jgi:hypothetical protein
MLDARDWAASCVVSLHPNKAPPVPLTRSVTGPKMCPDAVENRKATGEGYFLRRFSGKYVQLTTHPHLVPVKNAWSYTYIPLRPHGMFLTKCRGSYTFAFCWKELRQWICPKLEVSVLPIVNLVVFTLKVNCLLKWDVKLPEWLHGRKIYAQILFFRIVTVVFNNIYVLQFQAVSFCYLCCPCNLTQQFQRRLILSSEIIQNATRVVACLAVPQNRGCKPPRCHGCHKNQVLITTVLLRTVNVLSF